MKNEKFDTLARQLATQVVPGHAGLNSRDEASTTSASARSEAPAKWYAGSTGIPALICDAVLVFLIIVNVIRTLRHAMWRDELQVFMLAIYSSSPWSLLSKLKYEGHPGLWHMLVWVITRFTADPMWMQVMHIGLAIAVWLIIYWWSPFNRFEKILLLLSYFLFWEYFVISRSYVLIALFTFAFIALREQRSRPEFVLWLLLGLLANVHVFGAIWSIILAFMLALQGMRLKSVSIAGAAVYLVLLVLAVVTMVPAADEGLWGHDWFSVSRLYDDLVIPFGAYIPLKLDSIEEALAFIVHPATAGIPQFWSLNPSDFFVGLLHIDSLHPARLAFVFAVPIILCWLITRDLMLVLEFALIYLGILLFANIWGYPLAARHHGVIFLAFIASAWAVRLRQSDPRWSAWVLGSVLIINACGGVLTLSSELRPFSEGYDAASWIQQSGLTDTFLIGSNDAQVSTVAGYLGRPIYYLECECQGSYIVWNTKRQSPLSPDEFGRRLTKAVTLAGKREIILIRDQPIAVLDLIPIAPNLSVKLLKSFANAVADENFWIYQVKYELLH
jgi:hypothetical protein